jgi:hypothetical protein
MGSGRERTPLGKFFIDNAALSNEEIREGLRKTFPEEEATWGGKNFFNYRRRARVATESPTSKKRVRKPEPKNKPKSNGSVPAPEAPDPFATPDAKQLTALIMRVGLNTAEAVMARLKHIEERQR